MKQGVQKFLTGFKTGVCGVLGRVFPKSPKKIYKELGRYEIKEKIKEVKEKIKEKCKFLVG